MSDKIAQGWHVDKTVSISHLLTTVTMLIAVTLYLADQDKRIAENSNNIKHNSTSIQKQEDRTNRALDSIDSKLERLTQILLRRDI